MVRRLLALALTLTLASCAHHPPAATSGDNSPAELPPLPQITITPID